ncbi:hypothetical protein CHH28_06940 [Bacterioplanes sanyensis]|uniref:CPXCG motif-containing cysteine-rich protein n=1 Tax=Bacterioplanes sanyensis TaxID=1249553 RepID=A0A222FPA9_9GAMM|nr:CPXCG motif-containing cysteine-rich protein [Bacterioplanes sanyensis]ASP40855.1 hypothetical protein CHH28_06940 [Bacterioplanes sanyensis]
MEALHEHAIDCPYCGEPMTILVDPSEPQQEYIEDCQICCQPMVVSVQQDWQGDIEVSVRSENDA